MSPTEHIRRYMAEEIDADEYMRLVKKDIDADLEPLFAQARAAHRAELHKTAVWFFMWGAAGGVVIGYVLRWIGV